MTSSVTAVKLETDKSLPSWFKPAQVFDADFDAEAYLSDLRRFVSTPHKNITAAKPVYCKQFTGTPPRLTTSPCSCASHHAWLYFQVPLETLSSQLQKYLIVLKGKLVEVINEDYNDFVSLSTKLVNVDGAVTQMQKPLLTLKVGL